MNHLPRILALAAAAILLALFLPALASACPTCKDQLASDANNSGLVTGFFWSILFMLSMPLLLAGSWVAYIVSQIAQAEALAENSSPPLPPPASIVATAEETRS